MMKKYFEKLGWVFKQSRTYKEADEEVVYEYYIKEYLPSYERTFDLGPMIYKSSLIYSPTKKSIRVEMWNHKMLDYECYFDGICKSELDFSIIRELIDMR